MATYWSLSKWVSRGFWTVDSNSIFHISLVVFLSAGMDVHVESRDSYSFGEEHFGFGAVIIMVLQWSFFFLHTNNLQFYFIILCLIYFVMF